MQKICFVCQGNTCRSPFAEKLFNSYLKKFNIKDIKAFSLGISADVNQDINENTKKVLLNYNIKVKSRKAKKLTKGAYAKYDLFITMTKSQKSYVKAQNVFSFGEMIDGEDILDPYNMGYNEYVNMANQIDYYCQKLIQKILKLKGELV